MPARTPSPRRSKAVAAPHLSRQSLLLQPLRLVLRLIRLLLRLLWRVLLPFGAGAIFASHSPGDEGTTLSEAVEAQQAALVKWRAWATPLLFSTLAELLERGQRVPPEHYALAMLAVAASYAALRLLRLLFALCQRLGRSLGRGRDRAVTALSKRSKSAANVLHLTSELLSSSLPHLALPLAHRLLSPRMPLSLLAVLGRPEASATALTLSALLSFLALRPTASPASMRAWLAFWAALAPLAAIFQLPLCGNFVRRLAARAANAAPLSPLLLAVWLFWPATAGAELLVACWTPYLARLNSGAAPAVPPPSPPPAGFFSPTRAAQLLFSPSRRPAAAADDTAPPLSALASATDALMLSPPVARLLPVSLRMALRHAARNATTALALCALCLLDPSGFTLLAALPIAQLLCPAAAAAAALRPLPAEAATRDRRHQLETQRKCLSYWAVSSLALLAAWGPLEGAWELLPLRRRLALAAALQLQVFGGAPAAAGALARPALDSVRAMHSSGGAKLEEEPDGYDSPTPLAPEPRRRSSARLEDAKVD
jgi:hypothetical protein